MRPIPYCGAADMIIDKIGTCVENHPKRIFLAALALRAASLNLIRRRYGDGFQFIAGLGICSLPRSRHNPKIAGFDDAEVVGDRVAERNPIFGNLVAQEVEGRIGELPACGVTCVVRDMPVHEAP